MDIYVCVCVCVCMNSRPPLLQGKAVLVANGMASIYIYVHR